MYSLFAGRSWQLMPSGLPTKQARPVLRTSTRGEVRPRHHGPRSGWRGQPILTYYGGMETCLFCSIASGDPAKLVWSNDIAAAFNDIHPKAPVHVLLVPKKHIGMLDQLDDPELAGKLLLAVPQVAEKLGLKGAYRVQINNGAPAGQIIDHLHLHILGGVGRPEDYIAA
jgi:histidine triad (HIT) family protein